MKITLLYQVSHYINIKSTKNYLGIRGFCYIRPRYFHCMYQFILQIYQNYK